nr:MAG TPA: hypothetical protein [Caudoviricetes sp.]
MIYMNSHYFIEKNISYSSKSLYFVLNLYNMLLK